MWTAECSRNIGFPSIVQKCQWICVIMTVWFDQHGGHRNKLPCNLKHKCCQFMTDALKEKEMCFFDFDFFFFLTNWAALSNHWIQGSNTTLAIYSKIDVPSANGFNVRAINAFTETNFPRNDVWHLIFHNDLIYLFFYTHHTDAYLWNCSFHFFMPQGNSNHHLKL